MLESSLGPNEPSDFVRDVSQSGLTHEVEVALELGGGLPLEEFLIESDGAGQRRRWRRGCVIGDNTEKDNADDMIAASI